MDLWIFKSNFQLDKNFLKLNYLEIEKKLRRVAPESQKSYWNFFQGKVKLRRMTNFRF